MRKPDIRKGMPERRLDRAAFEQRYRSAFIDPAFDRLNDELDAITAAAWDACSNSRKSPKTRKAGPGYADPDYEISVDWLNASRCGRSRAKAVRRQIGDAVHLSSTDRPAQGTLVLERRRKATAWLKLRAIR